MEHIKMSFISLQRILRVVSKLKQQGGEVDEYEISTLKYLFEQCSIEEKKRIIEKFGTDLTFLTLEQPDTSVPISFSKSEGGLDLSKNREICERVWQGVD